jgi:hypothetical protein
MSNDRGNPGNPSLAQKLARTNYGPGALATESPRLMDQNSSA